MRSGEFWKTEEIFRKNKTPHKPAPVPRSLGKLDFSDISGFRRNRHFRMETPNFPRIWDLGARHVGFGRSILHHTGDPLRDLARYNASKYGLFWSDFLALTSGNSTHLRLSPVYIAPGLCAALCRAVENQFPNKLLGRRPFGAAWRLMRNPVDRLEFR